MNPVEPNEYGLTHAGGISDMNDCPTLSEQLQAKDVPYTEAFLPMATFGAAQASIISYTRRSTGEPVSVLVIPMVGPDSWAEEYYLFAGTGIDAMLTKNWPVIIDDLRKIAFPAFHK